MDGESSLPCYICRNKLGLLLEFELIGEANKICYFCIRQIKKIRDQINYMENRYIELYGKSIQVIIDPTQLFNIFKYIKCKICFKVTVCCKVCNDDHYFCLDCLEKFFQEQQLNWRKIQCPQLNCDQEIGHYIIVMFMKYNQFETWSALRYNLFCPRKDCQDILRIPPFGNLETQIIKIDNEQSMCSNCQIKICNICWIEIKESYSKHSNKCNSEKFRNELLNNYFLELDIAQCPKCKYYGFNSCRIDCGFQVQQCQICETRFCRFCKTANLELFSMYRDRYEYTNCSCYFNSLRRTRLKYIIIASFVILLFPIWAIALAGYQLTNYVKREASQINQPYKDVCYYIFFPLTLIFEIIAYFFYISKKIISKIDQQITSVLGYSENVDRPNRFIYK